MKKGKLAVITILGIQGGYIKDENAFFTNFEHKADYYFEENQEDKKEYFNTLPLLIDKFHPKNYKIISILTKDSKIFNQKVLTDGYGQMLEKVEFDDKYLIEDEKNIDEIFKLYNIALEEFDEVIVDVTHGFRHLPLLMIVELIMQNFQSTDKIKHIYFAKEIKKHDKENKGLYEIIDLKEYVDLANISFILTNFANNFTVANHIGSEKYTKLIDALNNFSNDIMALSLNNLFKKSSKELIKELSNIENVSIKNQATKLKRYIKSLTSYKGKKRYQTYYDLSKELFEKNYMLLSLSLLFESIRLYIKSDIKKTNQELVQNVEDKLGNDLYKICDFFKNLKWKKYDTYNEDRNKINISKIDYNTLKNSFPKNIIDLYDKIDKTRNNLSHANSDNKSFRDIKEEIKSLLDQYHDKCIKKKDINDLKNTFNNR